MIKKVAARHFTESLLSDALNVSRSTTAAVTLVACIHASYRVLHGRMYA
jgi:hypothetical protein